MRPVVWPLRHPPWALCLLGPSPRAEVPVRLVSTGPTAGPPVDLTCLCPAGLNPSPAGASRRLQTWEKSLCPTGQGQVWEQEVDYCPQEPGRPSWESCPN